MTYLIIINGILCGLLNLYAGHQRIKLYDMGLINAFTWVTLKKLNKILKNHANTDEKKYEISKYIKLHKIILMLLYLEILILVIIMAKAIQI